MSNDATTSPEPYASPLVIGAYAAFNTTAKNDWPSAARYLRRVIALDECGGLEVPWGAHGLVHDPDELLALIGHSGEHVFTLVTALMEGAAANPAFGLASPDKPQRRKAIELVRTTHDTITRLADSLGHNPVRAVELQSTPRVGAERSAQAEAAYLASVTEIAEWDWHGTSLVLEHCDNARGVSPVKGLLSLDAESEIALALADAPSHVGIGINWGRSVIETHDTATPVAHIRATAERGLLTSFMVSGVSDRDTPVGAAWNDTHVPPVTEASTALGLGSSLLTPELLNAAVSSAHIARPDFIGMKISAPRDASEDAGVALIEQSAKLVMHALEAATQ